MSTEAKADVQQNTDGARQGLQQTGPTAPQLKPKPFCDILGEQS